MSKKYKCHGCKYETWYLEYAIMHAEETGHTIKLK